MIGGAAVLERLVVKIMGDAAGFDRTMVGVTNTAERASSRMAGAGKAMTLGVTAPLVAMSAGLVKMASDAEETASKFDIVFSKVNNQANAVAKQLDDNYGLSGGEAKRMLSDTGDLLSGFGFAQDEALALSEGVQKLAVDLASFQNLEGGATRASEALTKGLLGEREMMKALGIAILDEDVKARVALNTKNGMVHASMRQAKAVATLQLATEQSKNSIGDYARTQDSFANQQRELTADITDTAVAFGQLLLPSAKRTLAVLRSGVLWVKGLSTAHKELILNIAKVAAVTGPTLLIFGKLAMHMPQLIQGLRVVGSTVHVVMGAIRFAGLAALLPFIKIIAIVAVVAAVIYGLAYLIVGPAGLNAAWTRTKEIAQWAFDGITGFLYNFQENFGIAIDWLRGNWATLVTDIVRLWVHNFGLVIQNIIVVVRIAFRLWAAWQGWFGARMSELITYVFSVEFVTKVVDFVVKSTMLIQKWAGGITTIFTGLAVAAGQILLEIPKAFFSILYQMGQRLGPILLKILTGELPNPAELLAGMAIDIGVAVGQGAIKAKGAFDKYAGPVLDEMKAFGGQMVDDFQEGQQNKDFFATARKIFEEESSGFALPGQGFEFSVAGPNFNFDKPAKQLKAVEDATNMATAGIDNMTADATMAMDNVDLATEPVRQMEKVEDKAGALRKNLEKPMELSVGGIQAVEAYTADAMQRLAEHRATLSRGSAPGVTQGGGLAALGVGGVTSTGIGTTGVGTHEVRVETLLAEIATNTRGTGQTVNITPTNLRT